MPGRSRSGDEAFDRGVEMNKKVDNIVEEIRATGLAAAAKITEKSMLASMAVKEAVIRACKARTRPIVITAFALVAGSSVILTDPIFQGLALSLLFGLLSSTLLTVLVIPAIYRVFRT